MLRRSLLSALLLLPTTATNATEASREALVKATYLAQLGRYVEWLDRAEPRPAQPRLCIWQPSADFHTALIALAASPTARQVEIVSDGEQINRQPEACHIIYAGHQLSTLLRVPRNTLIVSDDVSDHHATLIFVTRQQRLSFVINLSRAREQRLRLSSKLLALASEVR